MKRIAACILVLLCLCLPASAFAFDHQHGIWDIILKKHVIMKEDGKVSRVDYQGIKNDTGLFVTYLASLSSVKPEEYDTWTRDQKLAFLINAYNAFTIKLILDHYPVKSIRDIGSLFTKPWSIPFVDLLGQKRTLDDIEHGLIRAKGVFDEPRIHVALVCAAIGCPALRNEAYTAERLNAQLEDALHKFLSDRNRNRFNAEKNRFEISSIFKWYGQDFADKYGSLNTFLILYGQSFAAAGSPEFARINAGGFSVDYLDYDWNLNSY
jgi:hypothetical protein